MRYWNSLDVHYTFGQDNVDVGFSYYYSKLLINLRNNHITCDPINYMIRNMIFVLATEKSLCLCFISILLKVSLSDKESFSFSCVGSK